MLTIENINIGKYLIKHLLSIIMFIVIVIFDIVILFLAYRYFNKPIMEANTIRLSSYTKSLVRGGFVLIDGNYYYCGDDAIIVKDKIVKWENQDYYLDKDGILITNQKNYDINGVLYDIDKDGVLKEH